MRIVNGLTGLVGRTVYRPTVGLLPRGAVDTVHLAGFPRPHRPPAAGAGVLKSLGRAALWGTIGGIAGAMPLVGMVANIGAGAVGGAITGGGWCRRLGGMIAGGAAGYLTSTYLPSTLVNLGPTHFFLPAGAIFGAVSWGYTAYQMSRHRKQALWAVATVGTTCISAALLAYNLPPAAKYLPHNLTGWVHFVKPTPPISLAGSDAKKAAFIDDYLRQKGSPAADEHAGDLMVHYGAEEKVDPLILLAIAGHETNFGTQGVGKNGMLGVGAYDNDPDNAVRNPLFSGVEQQIRVGAETFAHLRQRGGATENSTVPEQLAAVNRAGWATDRNWHNGVERRYRQATQAAREANRSYASLYPSKAPPSS